MLTQSSRGSARTRRGFKPTLSDGLGSSGLEPRWLAVPVFALQNPGQSGFLAATDQATAFTKTQSGNQKDSVYGHSVTPPPSSVTEPQGQNSITVTADVSATVTGPGTNNQGDPQQPTSSEIQVVVRHHANESFTNGTGNPFPLLSGGSDQSNANTNSGDYNYVVNGAGPNGATITLNFQATLSGSTSSPALFWEKPSLDLRVGNLINPMLEVSVNGENGLVTAQGSGLQQGLTFKNFGPRPPASTATANVTETFSGVKNGTVIPLHFASSLDSNLAIPGTFPVTTRANDSVFNWNLTVKVS